MSFGGIWRIPIHSVTGKAVDIEFQVIQTGFVSLDLVAMRKLGVSMNLSLDSPPVMSADIGELLRRCHEVSGGMNVDRLSLKVSEVRYLWNGVFFRVDFVK